MIQRGGPGVTVSIKDVARKAGVAIGTVSRVFNHYPDVLPETQEKVYAAAKALRYSPNVNARSLSAKRPPNICLIGMDMTDGGDLGDPLYMHMQGILRYAASHRLEMSLFNVAPEEQSAISFVEYCEKHGISGAVVIGLKTDDPYFAELLHSDVCVVGIDLPVAGEKAGWVSIDNRAAAREGAEGLFERGAEDMMIVAGRKNTAVNTERLKGIADAFAARGLAFDGENCLYADFSRETARRKTLDFLKERPAPDSVFCLSDLMAVGVLEALRERGLRVPGDVQVLGFDGMGYAGIASPPLSTVCQDFRAVGYEAARLLHGLMKGEQEAGHRLLEHRLLWRDSTRSL